MIKRFALILFVFFTIGLIFNKSVKAEGTYANIGTSTSSNGSPDAVSWSQGYPIVVDSYGNYIVPTQQSGQTDYDLSFSNDKGATWDVITGLSLPSRVSLAYDSVNDALHAISAETNGNVTYRRYVIRRDQNYKITDFTLDQNFTSLDLDVQNACTTAVAGDPIAINKVVGGHNYLLAFWSISKACAGGDFTATRASLLEIANNASDGVAGSWKTLTGDASAGGSGPAEVNFTQIYSTPSLVSFFQQSALIKTAGSHINDIYYFNIDVNNTHEFRRFSFNNGTGLWSNGVTAPVLFGSNVNNAQGYNLKSELLSKPVEATGQDKVYVGIARWLDNTNGDTQSLFNVDNADGVNLAGNVYSAGGAHCIYPTFDISYDQTQNQVYTFYDISGAGTICGNVQYKTYDGTTFGVATPFYSVANRSVDIPVVYQNRVDDKMILFFRLNNAVTPGTPPHELYFGYVGLSNSTLPESAPANGANNNEDFSYSDFNKICSVKDDTSIRGNSIGSINLKPLFLDEFETPTNPYSLVFDDNWDLPTTWDPGIFEPKPSGSVNIYTTNGGYLISRPTFTANQSFAFRASFTQKNFQHIGIVDSNGFSRYAIFSTGNDGILKARTADGGGELSTVIGTGFYDGYHDYLINWTPTNLTFFIDNVSVATFATNIPTGSMHIILSNNDQTAGSDLLIESLRTTQLQALSGTYTSCPIDSGIVDADWLIANYGATISAGQTIEFQVRTSDDLNTWSAWSGALNIGDNIASPLGRYAQYLVTLTTLSTTSSPNVYDVNLTFQPPVPPDAVNDSASTAQDTAVDINVLANDVITTALDGSSPSITIAASHGNAVVTNQAGGVVTYTPTAGYSGSDSFTYRICDIDALCDTAIANIIVNAAPVDPIPDPDNSNAQGSGSSNTNNTCADSKPGIPTVLSAISSDPTKMNIKYKSGTGTFTKFEIEVSKLSQTYKDTDVTVISKDIFEYNFTNLNANTTYFFRIRAENGCSRGEWSSEFKAVTSSPKPTDISTSGDIAKPISAPVDAGGFRTEYLLIVCCPLGIILLLILVNRKKKSNKQTEKDFNARFK